MWRERNNTGSVVAGVSCCYWDVEGEKQHRQCGYWSVMLLLGCGERETTQAVRLLECDVVTGMWRERNNTGSVVTRV
jgi:hypothetical protein